MELAPSSFLEPRMTEQTEPTPETLDDLWSFLDDDGFEIPWPIKSKKHPEGKIYRIESPDAKTGLQMTGLATILLRTRTGQEVTEAEVRRLRLDEGEGRDLSQSALGPTYDEMVEDGVPWPVVQRLVMYLFLRFGIGVETADRAARDGLLSGKAPAPQNRAERRQAAKDGARSARTGSGGTSRR